MSIKDRVEAEAAKYTKMYKLPSYKMGRARMAHALDVISSWERGSLLDVGCGRGEILNAAERMNFYPVKGVELVKDLCDGERVVYAHGSDLPFAKAEYDYVTMLDVVEHIPEEDIYNVFKELHRVANRKILLCIANFPHVVAGEDLHITIKPYREWDTIIRREFSNCDIKWLPRHKNISETWEITI